MSSISSFRASPTYVLLPRRGRASRGGATSTSRGDKLGHRARRHQRERDAPSAWSWLVCRAAASCGQKPCPLPPCRPLGALPCGQALSSPAGCSTQGREKPTACAVLQSYRRCVHALITGAGVSTPTSRRKPSKAWVEENFAVTFASTKILVQTQWEAVRFDRVKHTDRNTGCGVLCCPSNQSKRRGARAPGAIGLSGATTLRAAAD